MTIMNNKKKTVATVHTTNN